MSDIQQRLKDVVTAWDALPTGLYTPTKIEHWLKWEMKPAIDAARSILKKSEPEQKPSL